MDYTKCQLLAFIGCFVYIPMVLMQCNEGHMDKFFACVKHNDAKYVTQLEEENQLTIENRIKKCLNNEGQCKLKGKWNSANNLCQGAKVCDCTFCDIFFDIVTAIEKDLDQHIKSGVCVKQRILDDLFAAGNKCVTENVGLDVKDIMKKHMMEDPGMDKNGRQTALKEYMLARSHIDRCLHFKQGRENAKNSDKCWWEEAAKTRRGKVHCGIAIQCARVASDDICKSNELQSKLRSLCTCLEDARYQTAQSLTSFADGAVKELSGGHGTPEQRAKKCSEVVDNMKSIAGINYHDTVNYAMTKCTPSDAPFTSEDMTHAMCETAATVSVEVNTSIVVEKYVLVVALKNTRFDTLAQSTGYSCGRA